MEEVVGDMESLETGREDVREEAGEEVGGEDELLKMETGGKLEGDWSSCHCHRSETG